MAHDERQSAKRESEGLVRDLRRRAAGLDDGWWEHAATSLLLRVAAARVVELEARLHHIRCVLVTFRSAPPTISTLQPVLDLAEEMAQEMCAEMEGKR